MQHVIVGAGGIARATAELLVARGDEVVLVSRSGRGSAVAGARSVALDATNQAELAKTAQGATSIINAANPPQYWRWQRDWPPLAEAILGAAQTSGAGLLTVSNLYGYGPVTAPMIEQTPLAATGMKGQVRAKMWGDVLAAHQAGKVRAVEVRASDYLGGYTLGSSLAAQFIIGKLVAGQAPNLPMGNPAVPHSWTADLDVARLLVALLDADDDAWGKPWHVPTAAAVSANELAAMAAAQLGVGPPPVKPMPRMLVTIGGLVVPLLHALKETRHQFEHPWLLDSSAAQARFKLAPTPLAKTVAATIQALRAK